MPQIVPGTVSEKLAFVSAKVLFQKPTLHEPTDTPLSLRAVQEHQESFQRSPRFPRAFPGGPRLRASFRRSPTSLGANFFQECPGVPGHDEGIFDGFGLCDERRVEGRGDVISALFRRPKEQHELAIAHCIMLGHIKTPETRRNYGKPNIRLFVTSYSNPAGGLFGSSDLDLASASPTCSCEGTGSASLGMTHSSEPRCRIA